MNKVELRYGLRENFDDGVITPKQIKDARKQIKNVSDTYEAAKKYLESICNEVENNGSPGSDISFYHAQGCSISLLLKYTHTILNDVCFVGSEISVKIAGEKDLAGIVNGLIKAAPKLKRQSEKNRK